VPADHHLADEVQALEVEALSGETLILSQYEEDAGFADYVTDFVAAARPMPEQVYPVRGIPTALSLAGAGALARACTSDDDCSLEGAARVPTTYAR
jgi:hypothetical protein